MPFVWKNKFVTEKKYNAMLIRSENGKKRKKSPEDTGCKNEKRQKKISEEAVESKIKQLCKNLDLPTSDKSTVITDIKECCDTYLKKNEPDVEKNLKKLNEVVHGNRVINIANLIKQLKCKSCSEELHISDIKNESKFGIASTFDIPCRNCSRIRKVYSGEVYKSPVSGKTIHCNNTALVLGK